MVKTKYAELVERLYRSTESEQVKWTPTVQEGQFQIALSGYAIRISKGRVTGLDAHLRPGRTYYYRISIFNGDGVLVDEFHDSDLTNGEKDEGDWRMMLASIYEIARRQALKADEAIDALLKELA